jgi:hypothetical protein
MTPKEKFRICIDNQIAAEIVNHPGKTLTQIAYEFGLGVNRIRNIAKARGIQRPRGAGSPAWQLHRWKKRPEEL